MTGGRRDKKRFPLLAAYDLCLKCSHLFNILDARGAISVTERVGVIARVRALAVGIAKAWVDQQTGEAARRVKNLQAQEPGRRSEACRSHEKFYHRGHSGCTRVFVRISSVLLECPLW